MGVIEAIVKGFSVAAKSRGLLAVLFVVGLIWNLINIPLAEPVRLGNPTATFAAVALGFVFGLVNIYLQSGAWGYVHEVIKTGQSTVGRFQETAAKFYLRILGFRILQMLFMIIIVTFAALIVLAGGEKLISFTAIGGLAIVVIAVILVLFVVFTPYAVIADDSKLINAITASIALVKLHFLKVVLIGLTYLLMIIGLGFLAGGVFGLLALVLKGIVHQVILSAISSLVTAYISVAVAGSFMSYYLSIKTSDSPASV